jgi:signal recognition particle receptor subunit beta
MVFFNWATMQMAAKIVYYGPGLCGKTSNLSYIYAKTAPNSRGEMVSLETESDRTLFFDLLPIEVGTIGGFKTRLQLYTVPGQVFYNTTRKLVLKGVDGLVFVADSQRPMREANIESFDSLKSNLDELGIEVDDLPLVLQYNKRDLKNILAIEELNADLNPDRSFPFFESEAINGVGVFEGLKEITKLTLKKLRKRMVAPHAAPAGPRVPMPGLRAATPEQRKTGAVSAAALARAAEEGVDSTPGHGRPGAPSPQVVAPAQLQSPFASEPSGPRAADLEAKPLSAPPSVASELAQPFVVSNDPGPFAESAPAATLEIAREQPSAAGPVRGSEDELEVTFDQTDSAAARGSPPPMKRVHVSNQMDILAELEGLRKQATGGASERRPAPHAADLDIEALLASTEQTRELRRKVEKSLNSDIFRSMSALQLAVRIQNTRGETIHTLEPVSLPVDRVEHLKRLLFKFTIDLENRK